MNVTAIIPAAGKGERIGFKKQFFRLGGKSLIDYSLQVMQSHDDIKKIILAVPVADLERIRKYVADLVVYDKVSVIGGGQTRQETVKFALREVGAASDVVIIHDGARPFVDKRLVDSVIDGALNYGAVVLGVPLNDTIKMVDGEEKIIETLPRSRLRSIQTPQGFRRAVIFDAYRQAEHNNRLATDDAGLVEAAGYPVHVLPGNFNNIKITTKEDIDMANAILGSHSFRMGFGVDIHQLVGGRDLVLGGVKIPYTKGCLAHSDGDVLIHALMDALLGAAGMTDIGTHFPPDDESYRDISSLSLLGRVFDLLCRNNWRVGNIDCTIALEKPRIASYITAMKVKISEVLQFGQDSINIKATTAEGLGPIGTGEGVAAYVVATIFPNNQPMDR